MEAEAAFLIETGRQMKKEEAKQWANGRKWKAN